MRARAFAGPEHRLDPLAHGAQRPETRRFVAAVRTQVELAFKPGEADGIFGVLTESAVRSFQTWAKTTADGVVGPLTWEKLDDADKTDPTLREGDRRVAVRGLQRRLLDAGYGTGELEVDGRFGPQTEAAVKAFQKASGITVDGIVGPETWDRLNALGNGG